ncbi:putative membrane protein [Rhodococcus phage E3]|uniref:hypothetical protein n=1 Tax=Rhodococcus phage E3 TaxID=1007869 RepID=UPI0002C6954F|nr:hypothetical protein M176_gp192 [Rhodococcus phage E3]AEQ21100.1 putative membrane protein [Rhodococcus phage E3]
MLIAIVLILIAVSGTAIGVQTQRLIVRNRAAQLEAAENDYRRALLADLKPEDVQWLHNTGAVWVSSERADLDPVKVLEAAAEEERAKQEAEQKRQLELAMAELNAKRTAARQAEASRLKMEAAKARQERDEWERKQAAANALAQLRKSSEKSRHSDQHYMYINRWGDSEGCSCDHCYEDWADDDGERSWSALDPKTEKGFSDLRAEIRGSQHPVVIAIDRATGEASVKRPLDVRKGQEYVIKTDNKPHLKYHPIPDSWKQALEPPRPIDYDPYD